MVQIPLSIVIFHVSKLKSIPFKCNSIESHSSHTDTHTAIHHLSAFQICVNYDQPIRHESFRGAIPFFRSTGHPNSAKSLSLRMNGAQISHGLSGRFVSLFTHNAHMNEVGKKSFEQSEKRRQQRRFPLSSFGIESHHNELNWTELIWMMIRIVTMCGSAPLMNERLRATLIFKTFPQY